MKMGVWIFRKTYIQVVMAKDEGRSIFGGYDPEKKTDLVASKNNIVSLPSSGSTYTKFSYSTLPPLPSETTYATDFKKMLWIRHT